AARQDHRPVEVGVRVGGVLPDRHGEIIERPLLERARIALGLRIEAERDVRLAPLVPAFGEVGIHLDRVGEQRDGLDMAVVARGVAAVVQQLLGLREAGLRRGGATPEGGAQHGRCQNQCPGVQGVNPSYLRIRSSQRSLSASMSCRSMILSRDFSSWVISSSSIAVKATYGVRKIISSRLITRLDVLEKSAPISGMSPRIGIFETESSSESRMRPPITIVV